MTIMQVNKMQDIHEKIMELLDTIALEYKTKPDLPRDTFTHGLYTGMMLGISRLYSELLPHRI